MKSLRLTCTVLSLIAAPVWAMDGGPQVLGCDHRFEGKEEVGVCLVVGSGMNQGISWIVFEVQGKRFRFEDSSPEVIELIDKSGRQLRKLKGKNSSGPCRPGGPDADVYTFNGNDRVCLYRR